MKQKHTNREYLLGGMLALLAAFPLVTGMGSDASLEGSVTRSMIDRAADDRADQSVLRRLRWSVLRDCAQRETAGEENACPDMNDVRALQMYWIPTEHTAAPATDVIEAAAESLNGYNLHILRRAQRVGQCPPDLDGILSGFQALCLRMIGSGDQRLNLLEEATNRLEAPSQHYRMKQQD